jgi:ribonuclease BN (tRNA processing enzyme)
MRVAHPGYTVMYKIKVGGKIIVFCPDNEYLKTSNSHKKEMIAFIQGADVFIHDSHESRETYKAKKGWGHTAWEDTVKLGIEAGVRHLFLTHHAPESSDVLLDERTVELDSYKHHFESVRFVRENEHFVVD